MQEENYREREREAESVVELASWALVVGTRKLGIDKGWWTGEGVTRTTLEEE